MPFHAKEITFYHPRYCQGLSWAVPCWKSQLQPQDKIKVTVKPLVAVIVEAGDYNWRKQLPPFPFPLWKFAPVKGQMDQHKWGDFLTVKGAWNKERLQQFYRPWGQEWDKGERLGVEKSWVVIRVGKSVYKVSSTSPIKIPEEDLCQRPQLKIFRCLCWECKYVQEHHRLDRPKSLTAIPYRCFSALSVCHIWFGEGSLPDKLFIIADGYTWENPTGILATS